METKFDVFIRELPNVCNEQDLCNLICSLGLYRDTRGIYGQYERFQVEKGGVWQDPFELATFLWNSKQDFRHVTSYLDIGTFNGYTFFIIMSFLKAFVNPDIKCKTVDPYDFVDDKTILPYIFPYYERCTSDEIRERQEQYDLVFIDGCHEAPWPRKDFDNCKNFASIVFFHDVVDKWCPDVRAIFEELASVHQTKKYVLSHDKRTFGIGVVFL